MGKMVYDVAVSLDGFIAREDGSWEGFLMEGEHAEDYLQRLQGYDTVVMGRKTYEAGYAFGLQPGERAYPHMEHYIVSRTLSLEEAAVNVVRDGIKDLVRRLKEKRGNIYLCGGGSLAGFLLDLGLVDQLVIKLNPVLLGSGVRLFGESRATATMHLKDSCAYGNGVMLLRYELEGAA